MRENDRLVLLVACAVEITRIQEENENIKKNTKMANNGINKRQLSMVE